MYGIETIKNSEWRAHTVNSSTKKFHCTIKNIHGKQSNVLQLEAKIGYLS